MAQGIALCFHFQVAGKCLFQIDSGLVGKADQYEQNVSQLVCKVFALIAFFFALFAVLTGDYTGDFTDFFHEYHGVSQLIKIPDTIFVDPVVNDLLGLIQFHRFEGIW